MPIDEDTRRAIDSLRTTQDTKVEKLDTRINQLGQEKSKEIAELDKVNQVAHTEMKAEAKDTKNKVGDILTTVASDINDARSETVQLVNTSKELMEMQIKAVADNHKTHIEEHAEKEKEKKSEKKQGKTVIISIVLLVLTAVVSLGQKACEMLMDKGVEAIEIKAVEKIEE